MLITGGPLFGCVSRDAVATTAEMTEGRDLKNAATSMINQSEEAREGVNRERLLGLLERGKLGKLTRTSRQDRLFGGILTLHNSIFIGLDHMHDVQRYDAPPSKMRSYIFCFKKIRSLLFIHSRRYCFFFGV